ncbi:TIGR03016 family PEP-CTERM system-associated outer membrane protein [Hydrogenophaga sp. 2FB]|uniref:TIGR03016 family PEP-CTERM system-associated outer membrane protein n=1 Tax=Hydrogenophaga sp. 2FB TaxID=2502187 RepID=UPI00148573F6|nr:TIGR03016 family PEP-CTERM system-associated outer membrane protein [Hydrogenophaga sp. 2FB]
MSGLLVLSLHVAGQAQELPAAQTPGGEVDVPVGPVPSIWVEPRISLSLGVTNNGNLADLGSLRRAEQITEISPGIGLVVNNARLRGALDYSLRGIYDARNTSVNDNIQQSLNANGTFNAWDNRAFVDVVGIIGQQAISAFANPSADSLGNANLAETSSFRVSPYLRGVLAGSMDYELRYGWQSTRTEAEMRSDITSHEVLARLGRQPEGGTSLGWMVEAGRTRYDYTLGAQQTLDAVTGRLFYAVSPTLTLQGHVGVESNDLLTADMKSYRNTGVGLDWRPFERARVVLERSNRYFGKGHNVEIEYASRRSVWRYTDSRDLFTNQLDGVAGTSGTLYGLVDALSSEPDPVLRAQNVNAELRRLGLPADYPVTAGFLASQATVQRAQELSLGLFGQRNVVIFALSRNTSRAINPMIILADDFSLANNIMEKGWRVTFAHRLTPLTSFNAGVASQSTEGDSNAFRYNLKTLTLGVSTRLAARTSGAVQLRHAIFKGSNPYKETAVLGVITHRF